MQKEWFKLVHKTGSKVIHVPQCLRWIQSCNSSKMVCNWILYSVDLACPEITKITEFFMAKCWKSCIICFAKNVKNHTPFVEWFLPKFFTRGRFMKCSMSEKKTLKVTNVSPYKNQNFIENSLCYWCYKNFFFAKILNSIFLAKFK